MIRAFVFIMSPCVGLAAKGEDASLSRNTGTNIVPHLGDLVRVRNGLSEPWQVGEVTHTAPILVKIGDSAQAVAWKQVDPLPMKLLQSTDRSLLNQDIAIGDVVRVRHTDAELWQAGVVTSVRPLLIRVAREGYSSPWEQVEAPDVEQWAGQAQAQKRSLRRQIPQPSGSLGIGDVVRVRNGPSEHWQSGKVTQASPILVKVGDSSEALSWKEVDEFPMQRTITNAVSDKSIATKVNLHNAAIPEYVLSFAGMPIALALTVIGLLIFVLRKRRSEDKEARSQEIPLQDIQGMTPASD